MNVRTRSLRVVMLRRVALVLGVQLLLTLFLAKFQLFTQVEALQFELNARLADSIGQSVKRALDRPITAVRSVLAQWNGIAAAPSAVLQGTLQSMVDASDAADSVYVLDPTGKVIHLAYASTPDAAVKRRNNAQRLDLDMSRSVVFRSLGTSTVGISPIFLSPITDQPTIAVSGRHSSGTVVVMEVNLSRLSEGYNAGNTKRDMQVLIVDRSGQIIADKQGEKSLRSGMFPIEALRVLDGSDAGVIALDGDSWLASAYRVSKGSLDWQVIVMRPLSQVYKPIVVIVALTIFGTVIVLLAAFLVLLAGVRQVASETERLSSNARELQAGRTPPVSNLLVAELSDVDAGLRDMASTLLQREQLLLQANEVLESRVAERTLHLEQANHNLAETLQKLETTQAELVQAAKMSALGGMVAGVAHELNTPVGNARLTATTLVHTANSILEMLAAGQVSRSELVRSARVLHDGAELVDRSLERAAEIVRAFKQVAVDQASHRRRSFFLADVLRENEVLLSPRLRKAGIEVVIQAPERLEMQSFPGDLGQVMTNLIENAMVHAYPGTSGVVSVTALPIGENGVSIEVCDQGAGIAPESLGRVFDPFYTTRLGQGGSGLGLSIVYNTVVQSLGGKITVHSQVGQGTCFRLELPLIAPLTAHESSQDSSPLAISL